MPVKLTKFVDSDNIATMLDRRQLEAIGARVYDDYEEDEGTRLKWMDRAKKALEVATQVWKRKTFPWPNASNVKYPLMTIASLNFHARAYPQLIPTQNLVTAKVGGNDPTGIKKGAGIRITKHMTWQLLEEMVGWEESMDKLLITLPITGSEFKKTYFDPQMGRNVSEYVSALDLVVNYYATDLESAARKTHILQMYPNEVIEKQRAGLFLDVDLLEATPRDDLRTRVRDDAQGMMGTSHTDDQPYMILEWHGFLDLDGDGYKEPYIVTIEHSSMRVLRIVARYSMDDVEYNAKGKIVRIQPQEYFTHYKFIPSPDGGFYGMGFGNLLGPLNHAVDTLINQLIDAGTLANMPSGFISRNLRVQGGNYRFRAGEWKWVNATGQDLKDSIMPMPAPEPSNVLFSLLGMLIDSGQRLTSTTDIMVGENPGQNQKATTTLAVVENGMKVFTAIYKRVRVSLGEEFKKLYKLNKEYVEFEDYWNVIDPAQDDQLAGMVLQQQMTDYQLPDMEIVPSADPSAVSQMQKLARAEILMQLLPTGLINPGEVIRRVLDAMEVEQKELLLQAPPPPPPPPEVVLEAQKLEEEKRHNMAQEQLDAAELQLKAQIAGQEMKIDMFEAATDRYKAQTDAAQSAIDSKVKDDDSKRKATKATSSSK